MNEDMQNITTIEAMGLAGSAIRAISDDGFVGARADLRTTVAELDELIENDGDD